MGRKVTIDPIMQNVLQAVAWIWSLSSFNTLATAQQRGWDTLQSYNLKGVACLTKPTAPGMFKGRLMSKLSTKCNIKAVINLTTMDEVVSRP